MGCIHERDGFCEKERRGGRWELDLADWCAVCLFRTGKRDLGAFCTLVVLRARGDKSAYA